MEAARTLGVYGEMAVSALGDALATGDLEKQKDALMGLAFTHSPGALPHLLEALSSPDGTVRERAARGLGVFGGGDAARAVGSALNDSRADVRETAAWALATLRVRREVPRLIVALEDPAAGVRERAAWALGVTGDFRAVPALRRVLKDPRELPGVREQVRWALERFQVQPTPERSAEVVASRRVTETYLLPPGRRLRARFEYGSLRIVPGDGDRVRADVLVHCVEGRVSCESLISSVSIESRTTARFMEVELRPTASEAAKEQLTMEAVLTVPAGLTGIAANLIAGSIDIEMPHIAVSRVRLRADLGSPRMTGHGVEDAVAIRELSRGGQELTWTGPGRSDVDVSIGVGSVSMRLL